MYNHQNQLELTFVVVQMLDQLIGQNDDGGGDDDDDDNNNNGNNNNGNNNNNNNNNKVLRTNPKI